MLSETKYKEIDRDFTDEETLTMNKSFPKIPKPTPTPRKNKAVTFRVTDEIYKVLKVSAEDNEVTVSTFVAIAIEDYINMQYGSYKKAQYLNTCDEKIQADILRHEKKYPPSCRQFFIARQMYPDAGQLNSDEMKKINESLERERERNMEANE